MGSRLFVGNLPYDATEEELTGHFSQVGPVSRVFLPLDRDTGRPRGFAFVEFPSSEHAAEAIQRLNQQPFKERPLVVNEARPSEARPAGGAPRAGSRPPAGGGFRPESRERTTVGGGPPSRPPAKSKAGGGGRRRRGKRSSWDEGPKKEPLKEKLGGRFYGDDDDPSDDDEDIDFENFATGEGDSDDE
jgi:RNA recognition motif-containing protein